MNRKLIMFFASFILITVSAGIFFISGNTSESEVVITGQYEIWNKENSCADVTKNSDVRASEKVLTLPKTLVSPPTEALQTEPTEFLYLNLNTASAEELMKLNGIGEVIAGRIMEYRDNNGGFRNIEEIMNVQGIGEKTFLEIKEHIYVEEPVYTDVPAYDFGADEDIPEKVIQPTEKTTAAPGTKFELNSVTREELLTIPDVDDKTADSILKLRDSIHYFSHTYELLYAEGMTEGYLLKIINYFYVENNGK